MLAAANAQAAQVERRLPRISTGNAEDAPDLNELPTTNCRRRIADDEFAEARTPRSFVGIVPSAMTNLSTDAPEKPCDAARCATCGDVRDFVETSCGQRPRPRLRARIRARLRARLCGRICGRIRGRIHGRIRTPRGITLVEVLVAAAILSVAALAALELLATSDAAALAARREAMASVEAERALAEAAEAVRDGREPSTRRVIDHDAGGETLAGCAVEVRSIREHRAIHSFGANPTQVPITRLTAEVTSPDGETLAMLERVAPRDIRTGDSP